MGTILLPSTFVEKINIPLIFLAGPIKCAPAWHVQAIEILFELEPNITIASPNKNIADKLSQHVMQGENDKFSRQRLWERYYLRRAAREGAILFWLPGELVHDCRKVYGQDTRRELSEWMTRLELDRSWHVCFGSDGNFSGLDVILCDLGEQVPGEIMHNTLEETCRMALQLAHS